MYPIQRIANWFISQKPMTLRKVTVLCYYAQIWYYGLSDKALMDEKFKIGQWVIYSPVLLDAFDGIGFKQTLQCIDGYTQELDSRTTSFLDIIYLMYGGMNDDQLEDEILRDPAFLVPKIMKKEYVDMDLAKETILQIRQTAREMLAEQGVS